MIVLNMHNEEVDFLLDLVTGLLADFDEEDDTLERLSAETDKLRAENDRLRTRNKKLSDDLDRVEYMAQSLLGIVQQYQDKLKASEDRLLRVSAENDELRNDVAFLSSELTKYVMQRGAWG